MKPERGSLVLLSLALPVLAACASTQVPTQQLTQSKVAIRAAEEVGAPNIPNAALHLKLARDQVQAAESLIDEGEMERAQAVLRQAELDAELALALARERKVQLEASETHKRVQALKEKAQ